MLLAVSLSSVAGVPARASEQARFPSNEDLRNIGSIENAELSPDGRRALLEIRDPTAKGGRAHLWLIDIGAGVGRQLTFSHDADDVGEAHGQWMPDGRSVLFVARRRDHTRLFRLPMDGGEAQEIAIDGVPDIDFYEVSPDGRRIALAARDPETSAEKRQREEKSDVIRVDHDPHGTRLYLMETATSSVVVVPVPANVKEVAWSRNAMRFVAICEAPNSAVDLHPARSAWLVTLADSAHPQELSGLPASLEGVTWSDDGRSLIFRAQAAREAPPGYVDLYAYDVAARGVANLSDGFEGSLTSRQAPIALQSGEVLQLAEHGLEAGVFVWSRSKQNRRLWRTPFAAISRAHTNRARSGWLFLGSSGGHPPVLSYAKKLSDAPRAVATPQLRPPNLRTVVPQRIQWENEGLVIEGLLYLPPDASAQNHVPLIVDVHGGPTLASNDFYDPFVDFMIGRGWAILRANPRGSTGRGAAFAAANRNDLGGADYRDIIAGLDFVLRRAPIDATRLALIGYSYGGEIAAFAEGRTDRFKAIVSGAPVIDQLSEYGTEMPESRYDRWFFGKPWEHIMDAWRQSSLSGVAAAKTPFLLLHGQNDTVDPPGQSYEMYRALRQTGVPVELIVYPREDHASLIKAILGEPSTEPWHGYDARRRIVDFIAQAFEAGAAN